MKELDKMRTQRKRHVSLRALRASNCELREKPLELRGSLLAYESWLIHVCVGILALASLFSIAAAQDVDPMRALIAQQQAANGQSKVPNTRANYPQSDAPDAGHDPALDEAGRDGLPYAQGAPLDSKSEPLDRGGVPLDRGGVPVDAQGIPLYSQAVPVDAQGVPIDTESSPADTQGTYSDSQGVYPYDVYPYNQGVSPDNQGGPSYPQPYPPRYPAGQRANNAPAYYPEDDSFSIDEAQPRSTTEQYPERTGDTMPTPPSSRLPSSQNRASYPPQNRTPRMSPTQGRRPRNLTPEDPNRPATRLQPNPYPSVPSLQDLYRQVPSADAKLRRYGSDLFLNGTGNTDLLPMDLPAGPDYVLGPGDGLSINLWGSTARRINVLVDRGGQVALPEAGAVEIAGHTLADAQVLIQKTLNVQYKDVRADISLSRLRTIRVYVVGDVQKPGAYDISSLSTPLNALYIAGGPTARGSLRVVRHYRQGKLVREVDLYDLILRGTRLDVDRLEPGDTILVPPAGAQVAVAGMVHRPAIYELKDEQDLSQTLDLAGGVLVAATLHEINVERIEAHEKRVLLSLKSAAPADDKNGLDPGIGNFRVQDGDRITISPILPYSDATVYLQGHVFRPGKYSYHPGMQISELLKSYQDLLPEPSSHAEIVRLQPPDYHPTTIEFKLEEVVGGDDPIELQPFDTIRIFGRYEADPPNVFVYGDVLRPGKYPLTEGMTAAGLVRMAGGFKRSALTQEAEISSYVVRNGGQVVVKHATVEIAKALSGDAAADVELKPEDILTVRQLTGWNDIGASVKISGEVSYPGTYGIEAGQRLSTLLRQAGGFRTDAYPEGAIFERVQIRDFAEKSRAQLIQRIESEGPNAKFSATASAQDRATMLQSMEQQQQHVVTALRSQPASGRMVIKISGDIQSWENSVNDVELRAGDVISIPKQPSFVLVSGQVYNSTAFTYTPGKNAGWYLHQAGGPTELANKKQIYVVRANGSVVGRGNGGSLWSGDVLSTVVRRGDTIVVPEKIISGTSAWKNLLDTAQLASSLSIAARVATSF